MKKITIIITLVCYSLGMIGQQETIMTKYTFNSMFFNPAYAGSHGEGIGTATVQYRNQWLGVKGAPKTLMASGEASFYNNSLGLGATLATESIGANTRNELSINTAYRIKTGEGFLSGGLRTSLFSTDSDFQSLEIRDQDEVYDTSLEQLLWLGIGFGVYYNDDNLYLGLSVPTIVSIGVRDRALDRMQHVFFNAGLIIGDEYSSIKWQPSILVKYQPAVPLQMTLSTQAWFMESFAVGVHWRYDDALALSAEFHFLENFKISTAYDLTISDLSDYSSGSPEVMLGYKFDLSKKRTAQSVKWFF